MTDQLGKETDAADRVPSASETRNDAEVQALLQGLARALTAGDGRAVAGIWETPALVVSDQQVIAVTSRSEVERFFSGAKDQYNSQGVTDTRPDVVRLDWITDKIALVRVRWPWLDRQGREVGEETSTYTLRRDETGALKIRAVTMHGAASSAH